MKQPFRKINRLSNHDVHDASRDNDDLANGFSIEMGLSLFMHKHLTFDGLSIQISGDG